MLSDLAKFLTTWSVTRACLRPLNLLLLLAAITDTGRRTLSAMIESSLSREQRQ